MHNASDSQKVQEDERCRTTADLPTGISLQVIPDEDSVMREIGQNSPVNRCPHVRFPGKPPAF